MAFLFALFISFNASAEPSFTFNYQNAQKIFDRMSANTQDFKNDIVYWFPRASVEEKKFLLRYARLNRLDKPPKISNDGEQFLFKITGRIHRLKVTRSHLLFNGKKLKLDTNLSLNKKFHRLEQQIKVLMNAPANAFWQWLAPEAQAGWPLVALVVTGAVAVYDWYHDDVDFVEDAKDIQDDVAYNLSLSSDRRSQLGYDRGENERLKQEFTGVSDLVIQHADDVIYDLQKMGVTQAEVTCKLPGTNLNGGSKVRMVINKEGEEQSLTFRWELGGLLCHQQAPGIRSSGANIARDKVWLSESEMKKLNLKICQKCCGDSHAPKGIPHEQTSPYLCSMIVNADKQLRYSTSIASRGKTSTTDPTRSGR